MFSAVAIGRRVPSTCAQCRFAVKQLGAQVIPLVASSSTRSIASAATALEHTESQDTDVIDESPQIPAGTEKPVSQSNTGNRFTKGGKGKEKGARLSKKQKKALENSRALAESLARSRKTGGQTPSSPSKPVDIQISSHDTPSISDHQPSATPAALTVEILQQYKPTRSPPLRAPIDKYTKEYGRAYQRLDKAFVRDQLWELWNQLRLNVTETAKAQALLAEEEGMEEPPPPPKLPSLSSKTGKRQIVQTILDQWGWPRVEQVERERQVQEWKNVITEKGKYSSFLVVGVLYVDVIDYVLGSDIPMTHAEAYLLLRRDPEFTQVLASEHRVMLNMVLRPNLCFHVKGKNHILQEIEVAIDKRRKIIKIQRMNKQDVPGGSLTELYQTISNMSGAFLETDASNKLQISYLDSESKARALELLYRAHIQLDEDPKSAQVLALTGQQELPLSSSPDIADAQTPQTYALYPFIPISISMNSLLDYPSQITESTNDWVVTGKSVFRLRRLGGWFGSVGHNEDAAALPQLEETLARNVRNVTGLKSLVLRDWLQGDGLPSEIDVSNSDQYERHVSLQQGHLLFSTIGAQEQATLTPPGKVQGDRSLGSMCRQLEALEMYPVFIPLSAVPFESAIKETSAPKRIRRVRYRSTSNRLKSEWLSTVEIEVALQISKSTDENTESTPSTDASAELEVNPGYQPAADAIPVVKHAYERSWNILCPDSDRDLNMQEEMSRQMNMSDIPELQPIMDMLTSGLE
ncbi:hypothetical protein QFC19_002547 [Naganishia cerealis]|uniref:Uncharacterized protein n=1 Tax=Naganishia cerealis TaxID=610337 RepID=A0ACC2W8V7_9TREE|nr:hypothetical protein QFC19_002547 [Naganishia cerealis]